MGFRPGKSVALFFIVYVTYLMLKISTEYGAVKEKRSILTLAECYIGTVFAIALFSDEIAVFALSAVLVMVKYNLDEYYRL
jgi:hypothetical protein